MTTSLKYLAATLVLGICGTTAIAAPVDLRDWDAESYPAVSGFNPGVWTPASDGSSVYQSVNGQPTLYYSDFNAFGTKVTGKIKVETTGDDDFIGFVLGFQPGDTTSSTADYLLVDWKQSSQSFDFGNPSSTPGGTADRGLAVSRVTGIPTADEFWQHTDYLTHSGGGVEELQRGLTLGSTGWTDNVEYEFTFDFGPGNLQVFVNGVKQLDIVGAFENGRIGFYNFSQSDVRYSAFTKETGSFPPPTAVPEPESWAMMIAGFGLAGVMIRRRRAGLAAI